MALLLVIAILSQGVHDVAIEHMGIPYPTVVSPPAWLPVIGLIFRLGFTTLFCRLAVSSLSRYNFWQAGLIVGMILACLSESFRGAIILFALTHGWVEGRWTFTVIDLATTLVQFGVQGCTAVLIARNVPAKPLAMLAAIVVAAVTINLGMAPAIRGVGHLLSAYVEANQPPELYQPPYALDMLTIIYSTFLEPTIAALFVARLVWTRLRGSDPTKIGVFVVLILGMTGRITLLIFNSFWLGLPPVRAFLSTGQFFAETVVMAFLISLLWIRSNRRAASANSASSDVS